jgi:uncharacterized membrane protein YadS
MADASDAAFASALAAERRRNARQIAVVRLVGTLAMLLVTLAFRSARHGYVGVPLAPLGA